MWHWQCTAAYNSIWFLFFFHLCVPLVKSRCTAKLFKHISSSNMSWTRASHSLTDSSGSCVGGFGVSLWSFMWLSCWWAVLSALPSWVSVLFDFEEFTHLYPSENTVLCKTSELCKLCFFIRRIYLINPWPGLQLNCIKPQNLTLNIWL